MGEISADSAGRKPRWAFGLIVAISVVIQCALTYSVFPLSKAYANQLGKFGVAMFFGAALGQLSMLAAYLAWSREQLRRRVFIYLGSTFIFWLLLTHGALSTGDSYSVGSIPAVLANITIDLSILLTIFCIAVRMATRRRLCISREGVQYGEPTARQYSLRSLLQATTVAAMLAAFAFSPAGRSLGSQFTSNTNDYVRILLLLLVVAAPCGLLAIPVMLTILTQSNLRRAMVAFGIYAVILLASTLVAIEFLIPAKLSLRSAGVCLGASAGLLLYVIGMSAFLRHQSVRLTVAS